MRALARRLVSLLASALALTSSNALAAPPELWGDARLRATGIRPFALEGSAARDPSFWVSSRLVVGAKLEPSQHLRVELELEGISGLLAGDKTTLGTSVDAHPFPVARDGPGDLARVLPRKAFIAWTTDVGLLSLGAQTFTWGTGMLANDGAGDPHFGDAWTGNVVVRALFGTRPLARTALPPLLKSTTVFVAGDWILRDDNASVYDGDLAVAAIAGVRAAEGGHVVGAFASFRDQTDRVDPVRPGGGRAKTDVVVLDAHARVAFPLPEGHHLSLEGELATVLGHTTRPWSDATFRDGASVRQVGGLARLRADHDAVGLTTLIEGGYASGDSDPRDGVARTFTMHTDHNVGMVLFDHVLPMISAQGVDRAAAPTLVGVPSPGTRFAINPGAVQNAIYTHTAVRFRPWPRVDLRAGYLFAVPAGDLVDAYQTGINGGYATSAGGQVQSRAAYGHELDARVGYTFRLSHALSLRAGGEMGVFFPGGAFRGVPGLFAGASARAVVLGRGMVSLVW